MPGGRGKGSNRRSPPSSKKKGKTKGERTSPRGQNKISDSQNGQKIADATDSRKVISRLTQEGVPVVDMQISESDDEFFREEENLVKQSNLFKKGDNQGQNVRQLESSNNNATKKHREHRGKGGSG